MKFVYFISLFIFVAYGLHVAIESIQQMKSTETFTQCKVKEEIAPGYWKCLK